MLQNTHKDVDLDLVGRVLEIETDRFARVSLVTSDKMTVDDRGLIHGGFTFGLADYAAMAAVNHPNVVLMKATANYIYPVKLGDILMALARVVEKDDQKRMVEVEVRVSDKEVFEGRFECYIPQKHILDE